MIIDCLLCLDWLVRAVLGVLFQRSDPLQCWEKFKAPNNASGEREEEGWLRGTVVEDQTINSVIATKCMLVEGFTNLNTI